MMLFGLMACTGESSQGKTDDSGPDTGINLGHEVEMFGRIQDPPRENNVVGAHIYEFGRPAISTTSDPGGYWSMTRAGSTYIHLGFEADTRVMVEAWIAPEEAADPEFPYPLVMGTEQDLINVYGAVGSVPTKGKTILFVDAMGTDNSCIDGASVNISLPYESHWRQHEDGVWAEENLTNPDRMDLMFLNVEPGMLVLDMVDPNGNPCVGPENVELKADIIAQVSYYCDMPGVIP